MSFVMNGMTYHSLDALHTSVLYEIKAEIYAKIGQLIEGLFTRIPNRTGYLAQEILRNAIYEFKKEGDTLRFSITFYPVAGYPLIINHPRHANAIGWSAEKRGTNIPIRMTAKGAYYILNDPSAVENYMDALAFLFQDAFETAFPESVQMIELDPQARTELEQLREAIRQAAARAAELVATEISYPPQSPFPPPVELVGSMSYPLTPTQTMTIGENMFIPHEPTGVYINIFSPTGVSVGGIPYYDVTRPSYVNIDMGNYGDIRTTEIRPVLTVTDEWIGGSSAIQYASGSRWQTTGELDEWGYLIKFYTWRLTRKQ